MVYMTSKTVVLTLGRKGIKKNWKMIDRMLAAGVTLQVVSK